MTDDAAKARLLERMVAARTPEDAQAVMIDARAWMVDHPDDIEVGSEAHMLHRLATAKVSALQGDTLGGQLVEGADFHSVDGILVAMGVTDAPLDRQREAIRWIRGRPELARFLVPLEVELFARGLTA
jgi:hypothetical protein